MPTPIVITALPAGSALGGTEAVPVVQTGVTVQVPASYFAAGSQPVNANLSAIAALSSAGLIARTGSGTAATRTVTGTAGRLTVANGDGVAGNPTLDLASGVVTASTYKSVTVDTYGRVTAGTNPTTLAGYGITDAQGLNANLTSLSGLTAPQTTELTTMAGLVGTGLTARTGTGTYAQRSVVTTSSGRITVANGDGVAGNPTLDLASGIVTPGTYKSITFDTYGRATAGTNPTTLAGYGIVDAQGLSTELTGLAAQTGTGYVVRTGAGSYLERTLAGTAGRVAVTNGDGVAGATSIDLASGIATPGTYSGVTVDTYGRITAGTTPATTPGTYTSVTVDTLGRVTTGTTTIIPANVTVNAQTAGYTILAADKGKLVDYTGALDATFAFTAAATLGAGFWCYVRNNTTDDTKILTLDPNASETIDLVLTIKEGFGGTLLVTCDGSNLASIRVTGGFIRYTTSSAFTEPSRIREKIIHAIGAGAGGGGGAVADNGNVSGGAGGGGGGSGIITIPAFATNTSTVITIGAGGTGGTSVGANTAGVNGSSGGSSSFGTILTASGGNMGLGGANGANKTGGNGGDIGDGTLVTGFSGGVGASGNPGGCSGYGGGGGGSTGAGAIAGQNGGSSVYGGAAGGGGGGVSPSGFNNGGKGGPTATITTAGGGGTAGTGSATAPTAGGAGTSSTSLTGSGGGGGGSLNASTGAAAAGGAGGTPGGGGGGGGSTSNAGVVTGTSGAGGNGGRGEIRIWYW